jgi:[glutamine synthetase] adenylyltransferase / [glutamine synthetase]-adenylyl-L-tyrosine phosphorylase
MPITVADLRFLESSRTAESFARLCQEMPESMQPHARAALAASPDPDRCVVLLERFRQQQEGAFTRLLSSHAGMSNLFTVFSYSQFLSEEVLQHPEWLENLMESGELTRGFTFDDFFERVEAWLDRCAPDEVTPIALAHFRRRQLLRIVLRDLRGEATLSETTSELSLLADTILEVTYRRLRAQLVQRFGTPQYVDEQGQTQECGFAVLSLGKLGGMELNYSSDIDLMFLYAAQGQTSGEKPISNKEFFVKLANRYTELLSTYTSEGMCYRVDLRLRPEGRLGEVAISLDAARQYYEQRARDWELQMLIKARVSAGEREVGRQMLRFVEPLIYSTTLDFSAVEAVSEARLRIKEELLTRRGATGMNVKLAHGGIRDIEFLVQCLQRLHGGRERWVRQGGTLLALSRLRDKELLSETEYSRLAASYTFLRHLEHRLQMAEDRQIHTLPGSAEAQALLARKMPGELGGGPASASTLLQQLNVALEGGQEIYDRVIHAQQPMYYTPVPQHSEPSDYVTSHAESYEPVASNLIRFLDQKAPRLAARIAGKSLKRGARHFELFLEKVVAQPQWLGWFDEDSVLTGYALDLFDHSPYFAEQLIRKPGLLEELRLIRHSPELEPNYQDIAGELTTATEVRKFFSREMMRLQAKSICLVRPVFETLERTSDLADAVIAACYRMAIDQTLATHPPATLSYIPYDQMLVIALGRLGMREFDLASDADLLFVLPDSDASELLFWTRVAERLIQLVTVYTGEGVMFSVDTRLRPNGRAGALVQFEGSYKEYFAKQAEAWEGITYMKSRGVAGNLERATNFLNELQKIDWRRYGQGGRSRKQLAQMRMRLEKEQGENNVLKAGRGGYYDIDFALMYLRLRGGGIFFKVLNTPARINVVEEMGHLERADAEFLRDAAVFYRAVDHGLRLYSGRAEGNLPQAPGHLQAVRELVERWTPDHLHDQPLDQELSQIRQRTREFFDRTFS